MSTPNNFLLAILFFVLYSTCIRNWTFVVTLKTRLVFFIGFVGTVSRKIFNTREPVDSIPYDHDENKYQRRGAIDWFTRWFWWAT